MENEAPERPDRRKQGYVLRRAILDFGMGIIICGFGILFLVAPLLKLQLSIDDVFRYIFSGLCLLYGGFRIYRGTRKNYFN
jgi:voltage-gated potassium channel Kch